MSIHLDRYYEPLHPVLLPDHLSGVRVHDSPPPTLTAGSVLAVQQLSALNAIYSGAHNSAAIRNDNNGNNNNNNDTDKDNTNRNRRDMAAAATLQGGLSMDMFRDPSSASAASVESVRIKEEDRRSPPEVEMDPRGTLETFIEHLTSPAHADSDPHLVAIGYELEALLAIYPSLKLVMSSGGGASRPASIISTAGVGTAASRSTSKTRSGPAAPPTVDFAGLSLGDSGTADTATTEAVKGLQEPEPKRTSQLWTDAVFDSSIWTPGERIRYEVSIPLWEEGELLPGLEGKDKINKMPTGPAPMMRVLVSLPPTYPDRMAPQLQLLGRYLGDFGIDAGLFGDITRTYISSSGSPFTPGDVCVFEGLTYARGVAQEWYTARLSEGLEGEMARDEERRRGREGRAMGESYPTSPSRATFGGVHTASDEEGGPSGVGAGSVGSRERDGSHLGVGAGQGAGGEIPRRPSPRPTFSYSRPSPDDPAIQQLSALSSTSTAGSSSHAHKSPASVTSAQEGHFPHFTIHISQPIVDRKSTFIGHAIKVTDEREVPLVIHEILSDKKVAKAAHPAMFAYRVVRDVGGVAGRVVAADCDDDGETAAGSRLAHLLDILELEDVLVVVSRWYGGVHLGSDRFKHINQAARDALEVGGFLGKEKEKDGGGGKGRRK